MTGKRRQLTKAVTGVDPEVETNGSGPSDLAETRIAAVLGLKQFMLTPVRTLLIKGLAGTGKTTVALEILKAAGEGKGAYLSSRVPKELLEKHIPAMKETLENQDFLVVLSLVDARFRYCHRVWLSQRHSQIGQYVG